MEWLVAKFYSESQAAVFPTTCCTEHELRQTNLFDKLTQCPLGYFAVKQFVPCNSPVF